MPTPIMTIDDPGQPPSNLEMAMSLVKHAVTVPPEQMSLFDLLNEEVADAARCIRRVEETIERINESVLGR